MRAGFRHAGRLVDDERVDRCIDDGDAIAGGDGVHAERHIGQRVQCEIWRGVVGGRRRQRLGGQLPNGAVVALVLVQRVTQFWVAHAVIVAAVHIASVVTGGVVHFWPRTQTYSAKGREQENGRKLENRKRATENERQ